MSPGSARTLGRFVRSEVGMLFRRRRNQALLVVLGLVPVLIGGAVKANGTDAPADSIFGNITENGLFAALAAFLAATPIFLPLVVAVVAGDSVAGEANSGTLRYLLTVPVGRTRLLATKFTALIVWIVASVGIVAGLGLLTGLVLFPTGDLVLLSGRQVSYAVGLERLLLTCLYLVAMMLVVGAIGLFVSTLTEVPIAAIAATLTVVIATAVVNSVPQLASIHAWMPTHYWTQWIDLLRDPVRTEDMTTGLFNALAYVAAFLSLAWARFAGKDITS